MFKKTIYILFVILIGYTVYSYFSNNIKFKELEAERGVLTSKYTVLVDSTKTIQSLVKSLNTTLRIKDSLLSKKETEIVYIEKEKDSTLASIDGLPIHKKIDLFYENAGTLDFNEAVSFYNKTFVNYQFAIRESKHYKGLYNMQKSIISDQKTQISYLNTSIDLKDKIILNRNSLVANYKIENSLLKKRIKGLRLTRNLALIGGVLIAVI